ncbi:tRNA (adenosine(37)-N6)-threonylcarbamoyltransferase complex dimerization subunit type 1 TsaB [Phyllobacterium sp. YR531]|uniref:tRNA (adenosine(37)-N6)-threonylcarbamoyltransferase complex dimerization subunit type 1 TsaB n=1 Tax=Phyllobacterium sp. YR531 TaxID=1144343 RepID=UPI00026F7E18|nr:tRNA (adenosine(37)-N6)-threonylcarbamoyltransferase complex dimerization subunit type 1 TsaB [Phyllobacterium sp. YR531]EJN05229.1 universal bacterial protein YeaZ [Phyllobacterium sp. YR531]
MKLLALDTAANLCSVAIFDTETGMIVAQVSEDIGKGHAERLMALIEQAVASAGTSIREIGKVVTSIGPGSFTGVRVGVATARGLALALRCPAIGISTLQALAFDAGEIASGRPVLAVIDARREEIYAQFFDADGNGTSDPIVAALPEVIERLADYEGNLVLAGSASGMVNSALDHPLDIVSTMATGTIEAFARLGMQSADLSPPSPLYLRGLDVKPQQGFVLKRQIAE